MSLAPKLAAVVRDAFESDDPRPTKALTAIGLLWMLCWPFLCVSTGELKPRGLFVDENALPSGGAESRFSFRPEQRCGSRFEEEVVFEPQRRFSGSSRSESIVLALLGRRSSQLTCSLANGFSSASSTLSKKLRLFNARNVDALNVYAAKIRRENVYAVLVVDVDDEGGETCRMRVLSEGKRGLRPNMDLLSVLLKRNDYFNRIVRAPTFGDAFLRLFGFRNTVAHQAFLDDGVDAVTLQVRCSSSSDVNKGSDVKVDDVLVAAGRTAEALMRSVNNLEELLHHSTNGYFMISEDSFVDVNEYFPSLTLASAHLVWSAARAVSSRDDSLYALLRFVTHFLVIPSPLLAGALCLAYAMEGRNRRQTPAFAALVAEFFCLVFVDVRAAVSYLLLSYVFHYSCANGSALVGHAALVAVSSVVDDPHLKAFSSARALTWLASF